MSKIPEAELEFIKLTDDESWPSWAPRDQVVRFFHETMKPYEDTPEDIERALDFALGAQRGPGAFLHLVRWDDRLVGALLMLDSRMGGYVPRYILLFVTVHPDLRGRGVGGVIVTRSLAECDGPVKLHVEYDNPAKRLYERLGFTTKYAEMRHPNA